MASSSDKRYKTIGTKRKDKEPERTHSSKFLSRKHEKHFKIVQDRRLLMERKAGLIPDLAPQFGEQIVSRNWRRLATYPAPANIAVVKEFYTNARRLGDHLAEDYLSYVRGHVIRYDPHSINKFLDTEWVGEQCQFALNMEEGTNFDDVESVMCVPRGHFQRNKNGAVVNIRRTDLTPLAKYWMAFFHANIQPCSHVSDITISRALLLYCVLRGLSINIGQVIPNEIQMCANTMNTKAPLGHPSLITYLCELAGVNIFVPPFERSKKAIDEAYYRKYCGGDEAAQPVPPLRPRRGRRPPQGQVSHQAITRTPPPSSSRFLLCHPQSSPSCWKTHTKVRTRPSSSSILELAKSQPPPPKPIKPTCSHTVNHQAAAVEPPFIFPTIISDLQIIKIQKPNRDFHRASSSPSHIEEEKSFFSNSSAA
ncbi:hypothetical protein LR48_Vigan03g107000 [Vigna angularis]|uniref:Putative plant transposon protein domain-containing protein n=1 Tax=Phaseolus angularis TaxID=3914 RepID=A0A0L9U4D6_PHAAN|nr:hypothetical protein LR48_Vigan03g107000 [Vigna angularis]